MLKHLLISAARGLARDPLCTLLNIAGLAVGMAVCLLMLLHVQVELSYDRAHREIERIYLTPCRTQYGRVTGTSGGAPPALGPALAAEHPEIDGVARYLRGDDLILQQGEVCRRERVAFADPGLLDLLTFPYRGAAPAEPFPDPFTVLLTESTARRLFGHDDPRGRWVRLDRRHDLRVTGVLADPPPTSSLTFGALAPLTLQAERAAIDGYLESWRDCSFLTFVRLHPGVDAEAFGARIGGRIRRAEPASTTEPFLFPFRDYHLHAIDGSGGAIERVRLLMLIAGLVLLMACINFTNLATARAGRCAAEIGVRHAAGATRGRLLAQFYLESVLQALLALAPALGLVRVGLPWLASAGSAAAEVALTRSPLLLLGAPAIALLAGLVSGTYPALVLSSIRPAAALRGGGTAAGRGLGARRGLVLAQFAITAVLLTGTLIVRQQHAFLARKDLGLDPTGVVSLALDEEAGARFEAFREALRGQPGVLHVTRSTHSPAAIHWNGSGWDWDGRDPGIDPFVTCAGVDLGYPETLGLDLVAGEFFHRPQRGGHAGEVVVNQACARLLGEASAVGRRLYPPGGGEEAALLVIGVVRDFHFRELTRCVGPLVLFRDLEMLDLFPWIALVRCDPASPGALARVEAVWREQFPDRPFEPRFLAETYARGHGGSQRLARALGGLTAVALLVAGLGLLGLAAFVAEQRTREIGIRKTLGAPALRVTGLLMGEFLRWVILAQAIGLPLAWLLARRWLERFPYRIDLGPGPFLCAAIAALAVATVAVGARALRAAAADPLRALRRE